jgi:hypothetical protein
MQINIETTAVVAYVTVIVFKHAQKKQQMLNLQNL